MTSRYSDDLDLVAPEDYVPTTLHALLMHLHVSDAARDVQEAAVRGWLQDCRLRLNSEQPAPVEK